MTRWWLNDGPAAPDEPAEPVNMVDAVVVPKVAMVAPAPAEPDPPPLSAPERIAEILERFYLWDARLTGELLGELANCSAEDLVRLFSPREAKSGLATPAVRSADVPAMYGPPPPAASATAEVEPTAEPEPAARRNPAAELPHLAVANPPEPVWDSNGFRISRRLPSSFPRYYDPPRRPATHWSR